MRRGKLVKNIYIFMVLVLLITACGIPADEITETRESPGTTVYVPLDKNTTTTTSTTTPPITVTEATTTTSTTVPKPELYKYDIVVVGDTAGAIAAAVQAARMGSKVALLSDVGYFGGQMSASGVSTMDEGGSIVRDSGLYAELTEELKEYYGKIPMNKCYYSYSRNRYAVCPEPHVVHKILSRWLKEANVDVFKNINVSDVLMQKNRVVGVFDEDMNAEFRAKVVLDGTEFSDLYPLVEGLSYETGNGQCVQDATWLVIRSWYPNGVPEDLRVPEDAVKKLKNKYGEKVVEGWLNNFRRRIANPPEGVTEFPGWQEMFRVKLSHNVIVGYRGLADSRKEILAIENAPGITRSGVNFSNDSGLSSGAIEERSQREKEFMRAMDITYAYMWYLEHELGVLDWGISNDLGYNNFKRMFNNPTIPDSIEKHFPLMPYIREGRRLTKTKTFMTWRDVSDDKRGRDNFDDSVMVGSYFSDFHGCAASQEERSGYGSYDVSGGIFIPTEVKGFLPALARAAGVDRAASSSLRMQPTEMLGGQATGAIAALAVKHNIDVQEVNMSEVRSILAEYEAVIDVVIQ